MWIDRLIDSGVDRGVPPVLVQDRDSAGPH